jgi:hypothetical protein
VRTAATKQPSRRPGASGRSAPIELGAIVATAESQCRIGAAGSGDAAATLWAEARKSLEVTALTQVLRGTSTRRAVSATSPYRAISVEKVTERGWGAASIESIEFVDAPTATIPWGTGHQQGAIVITTIGR